MYADCVCVCVCVCARVCAHVRVTVREREDAHTHPPTHTHTQNPLSLASVAQQNSALFACHWRLLLLVLATENKDTDLSRFIPLDGLSSL